MSNRSSKSCWQHIQWRSRGSFGKVHLREYGYHWTLYGIAPMQADEVVETAGDVTCKHCIRIARARKVEGWKDA